MQQATSVPLVVVSLLLLGVPAAAVRTAGARSSDRTITQVVKLLQEMLASSEAEATTERELYTKFKCYCDDEEAAKKEEISCASKEIGLLENEIDRLQADSAGLSKETAKLSKNMDENNASRTEADALRTSRHQQFLEVEADLSEANGTAYEAIEVLAAIGADQTLGDSATDHSKFMATYKSTQLMKLRTTMKQALLAASAFLSPNQAAKLEALQDPFTGTYTSQAGEVVGILKDMRDTILKNLATARATETEEQEAHDKFMANMKAAWEDMKSSYDSKQGQLSANDAALGSERAKLTTVESRLAEAEAFLSELQPMCSEKAKDYEKRVVSRTKEQAALAEAISVLNNDLAFETFGSVTATRNGPTSFLQQASVQKHVRSPMENNVMRDKVRAILLRAANANSTRLSKVVAMLDAENPFEEVLDMIKKIKLVIQAERDQDAQQKKWCESERSSNGASLDDKKSQITTLDSDITTLDGVIEDPVTGLKKLIANDEESLRANTESQKTETEARKSENLAYQKNVQNLVKAQALMTKAITVLQAYYSKILEAPGGSTGSTLIAVSRVKQTPMPAPPPTWTGPYTGASSAGGKGSTDAIGMLELILSNTKQEEVDAHTAEKASQHTYEDSMQQLMAEVANLQKSLASNRLLLTQKEKELLDKDQELKTTESEKAAIEAYLLTIKPGCDFIITNFKDRMSYSEEELFSLDTARDYLESTAIFFKYADKERMGKCMDNCVDNEDHVKCKACLAKVSIPGYCAGHPDTEGCS